MASRLGSSNMMAIEISDDDDEEIVCLGATASQPKRGQADQPIEIEDKGRDRKRRRMCGQNDTRTPLATMTQPSSSGHSRAGHSEARIVPATPSTPLSQSQASLSNNPSSSRLVVVQGTATAFAGPINPRNATPQPSNSSARLVKQQYESPRNELRVGQITPPLTPPPRSLSPWRDRDVLEFDEAFGVPTYEYDAKWLSSGVEMGTRDVDNVCMTASSSSKALPIPQSKALPRYRPSRTYLTQDVLQSLSLKFEPLRKRMPPPLFSAGYYRVAGLPYRGVINPVTRMLPARPFNGLTTILNSSSLRRQVRYAKTSGAITNIAQSGPNIVVASSASAGTPDDETRRDSDIPYNANKNLVVFREQHSKILERHVDRNVDGELFYTVNEVAFDPLRPNRFASAGNDGRVVLWDMACKTLREDPGHDSDTLNECHHTDGHTHCRQRIACDYDTTQSLKFRSATHSVSYRPNTSSFAVGCHNGSIYFLHSQRTRYDEKFELVQHPDQAKPGHVIWGHCLDSNEKPHILYASSEGSNDDYAYTHAAFDFNKHRIAFKLKDEDSSDNMALDSTGRRLALATVRKGEHRLSFFDVARNDGRVVSSVNLSPATLFTNPPVYLCPDAEDPEERTIKPLEINDMAFSPDGLFIALTRNDNVTDIYDTRFLDQVYATLPHTRSSLTSLPLKDTFGVFGGKWLQGRGWGSLGLVTGGSDGCVRLWDVSKAPAGPEDSTVLAELNHDIAHFTIGDPSKGEKRLVVGDCGGEVHIFD